MVQSGPFFWQWVCNLLLQYIIYWYVRVYNFVESCGVLDKADRRASVESSSDKEACNERRESCEARYSRVAARAHSRSHCRTARVEELRSARTEPRVAETFENVRLAVVVAISQIQTLQAYKTVDKHYIVAECQATLP